MNTDLETYGVEAFTDWEFTGQFPYIETVAQAVHIAHGVAGHTEGFDHTSFHGYAHTVGGAVPDRERLALPNSHRVGQGPWDRLMALCDERGSPFPEPDLPALFPINSSKRMYKWRAKDINDACAEKWRESQPTPGAGQPPLSSLPGEGHLVAAAGGAAGYAEIMSRLTAAGFPPGSNLTVCITTAIFEGAVHVPRRRESGCGGARQA